jgi:nucleotide-binding universal stress UspA family protein
MYVLVATDGSPSATAAIDLVAGIDWPAGTTVRAVAAMETGAALFGGPWPAAAAVEEDVIEEEVQRLARDTVEAARTRLARPGLDVVGDVTHGRAASLILELARDADADLIVMGSRGHGTIASMVLGSVSAEVVDHARTPVLVARGSRIGKVVLAWDGSTCGRVAAEVLRTWPIFAGSTVRVVSVADIGIPWWTGFPQPGSAETIGMYMETAAAARAEHQALAQKMAGELRAGGLDATPEAREGDPAAEVIAAARAWDADLIVLGTHGRTGVARILLGSVARNVLYHAPCSVLIAREPAPSRG